MPIMHHDNRPLEQALAESKQKFQEKLEARIHGSDQRVRAVIEQVHNDQPTDVVVLGRKLGFTSTDKGIRLIIPDIPGNLEHNLPTGETLALHDHAFGQVCDRSNLKHASSFLKDAMANGLGSQVAALLTAKFSIGNGSRYLLRSVRGEVRGFLSDSFRRLDSRPLLEAFVAAIKKYGARPYDGFALQTKMSVRAVLPRVYEPVPGEFMVFGAQLSDSDFGDGAVTVSGWVERMICTNLATTEDCLRQIHLGRRLTDNVTFSQRTMELDTQAFASGINDVAAHVLGSGAVDNYLGLVRKAHEDKMEPSQIQNWVKGKLNKGETDKAINKFNSPDVELLPAGQNKWRWSNAISWLANETEDEHRKLDLQELAGSLLK